MKPLPKSLWASTATPAATYPAAQRRVGGRLRHRRRRLHRACRRRSISQSAASALSCWKPTSRDGVHRAATAVRSFPGLKLDPSEMRAKYGEERGRRLTKTVGGTADLVFDLIQRHGIDCDAARNGWIQGAPGPKGLAEVRNRAEEWAAEGAEVAVLDRDQVRARIGGGDYVGAFLDRRGGTVNPLSYARGLARAAASAGAKFMATARPSHWNEWASAGRCRRRRGTVTAAACGAVHERIHGSAMAGPGGDDHSRSLLRYRYGTAVRQPAPGRLAGARGRIGDAPRAELVQHGRQVPSRLRRTRQSARNG